MSDPAAQSLAALLSGALRPRFPAAEPTALHLAELLLDGTEAALQLDRGGDAGEALARLELLAQSADVYAWDGPPGWDELLRSGLRARGPLDPGPSPLDGLGEGDRAAQRRALHERARAESRRFLLHARSAAREPGGADEQEGPSPRAAALVAAHASLLRLLGLAALAPSVELPVPAGAGALASRPGAGARLCAEMDARADVGSDFAAAHDEWLARLLIDNPEAAARPGFRTFFAGLAQTPRLSLALRAFRDCAAAGRLPATADASPEALVGAVGGFQPVRWAALRAGAPAALLAALCPPAPADEHATRELARLQRKCDAALDVAGRLWEAKAMPLWEMTGLASLLFAKTAGALALWQELGGGA